MSASGDRQSRLLVVDDNAALAENLSEILEDAGYAVAVAGSLRDALARAEGGVDVALVDLKLPDGEGTELTAKLQALHPDCEVILLTGFATVESAADAVRAGAWAYLVKPAATGELLLAVEQAMKQVKLRIEKRELARRAQVAEKLAAVGTMTAGLSHEIRNPLNAAALQLEVLDRRVRKLDATLQPKLLEPLTLVREEIGRLGHILEDFLQFARPVSFTPRPVDLGQLVTSVAAFLQGDAERRSVKLVVEAEPGAVVPGDDGRLRQVLMNLTLNALDATPAGGEVRLIAAVRGANASVEVRDTGSGIPAEKKERIFEPFFTTKAAGSGLGLAIVHAIITQHAGTIAVMDGVGGGTRFVLSLPRNA